MAANLGSIFGQLNTSAGVNPIQRTTSQERADNPSGIAKSVAGLLGGQLTSRTEKINTIKQGVNLSDPASLLAAAKAMNEFDTQLAAQWVQRADKLTATKKSEGVAGGQARALTQALIGAGAPPEQAQVLAQDPQSARKFLEQATKQRNEQQLSDREAQQATKLQDVKDAANFDRTFGEVAGRQGVADTNAAAKVEAAQIAADARRDTATTSAGADKDELGAVPTPTQQVELEKGLDQMASDLNVGSGEKFFGGRKLDAGDKSAIVSDVLNRVRNDPTTPLVEHKSAAVRKHFGEVEAQQNRIAIDNASALGFDIQPDGSFVHRVTGEVVR